MQVLTPSNEFFCEDDNKCILTQNEMDTLYARRLAYGTTL